MNERWNQQPKEFWYSLDGRLSFGCEKPGMEGYNESQMLMRSLLHEMTVLFEKYRNQGKMGNYSFGFEYKGSIWDDEESQKQIIAPSSKKKEIPSNETKRNLVKI